MSTLFPLANADDSAYADAFGADPWSVTSILSPSVEATSPSLRNYNLEHLTPQMVPAALKTAEPSVIPTAKSTQVLAARATAGVVTRPLTAELVANLAAPLPLLPLLLLLRILRLLVPTVVAAPLLLVLLATPTVPMEVAVLRTDTAERRPITVVQDARADAQILLVEEEEEEVHPTLPVRHLPHLRSPFSESQPLVLQLVQPPLTAHVALTITTPSAGIGPKEVAALRMVSQNPLVQAGVPAMHAGLLPNGKVVFLDKVENYTQLKLPNGQYAYSAEYDPNTRAVVPLSYKTNAFCSGGAFLADGRFVSIGGNAPLDFDPTVGDGFNAVRYLSRSASDASLNGQSWSEPGNKIASPRWYASVQTMPDGTLFVASGSKNGLDPTNPDNNNPTYEILNAVGITSGNNIPLEILNKNQPYYMYPFIHLMNNGQLFIQVAKSAEIFNVGTNAVVKALPDLPGDFRTYPNTGGSVLLPLSSANGYAPDVVICGGGAYQDITSPTDPSCGRIQPLSANPTWQMESMPEGRGMVEGTLLPDGSVIWVNGCNVGAQGFGVAKNPTLEVLIYDPAKPVGQRFTTGPASGIARLYHSVALLLLDGTMMIAGSNPVEQPVLTPVPNRVPSEDFVTEFRVEIYTPPYLSGANANKRPTGMTLSSKSLKADGSTFTVKFTAPAGNKAVKVALYHGGFVTHSVHMNHRMIFLDTTGFAAGATSQTLAVKMPPNRNVAQPGPYVVYVTVDGVPAVGQFVSVA
ncbi:MAG: hypothetical protein L6R37_003095 [Teloschistes peruensis]|nr:MAG: hypothetical protein L6R37_003095 [Teloschistes peruensis]